MKGKTLTYKIKDIDRPGTITLTYDSDCSDRIKIRMAPTTLTISVTDLADVFVDMDRIFANALNSSGCEDK